MERVGGACHSEGTVDPLKRKKRSARHKKRRNLANGSGLITFFPQGEAKGGTGKTGKRKKPRHQSKRNTT